MQDRKIIDLIEKSQEEKNFSSKKILEISRFNFLNDIDKKDTLSYMIDNYESLDQQSMNNLFIKHYDNHLFKKYIENCFPDTKYCTLKTIDNIYNSLNSENREIFFLYTSDVFVEEIEKIRFYSEHTQSGANHFLVLVRKIEEEKIFNIYNPLLDKLFNSFLVSKVPDNIKNIFFKDIINRKIKFISKQNIKNVLFLSDKVNVRIGNLTIKPKNIEELNILFDIIKHDSPDKLGSLFISLLNSSSKEIKEEWYTAKYVESLVDLNLKPNYKFIKNMKKLLSKKDINIIGEDNIIHQYLINCLDKVKKPYLFMMLKKIDKEFPTINIKVIKSHYEKEVLDISFNGKNNAILRKRL